MINLGNVTGKNKAKHNPKWPYIPDHLYRIFTIGGSRSGKSNAMLNLINHQLDINKTYLCTKDPYESNMTRWKVKTNKREKVSLKHYNDPKGFILYSNDMQDAYKKYWWVQSKQEKNIHRI